jgi:hypothetical protein
MCVRLFIACSEAAIPLGKALRAHLKEQTELARQRPNDKPRWVSWEVVAWWATGWGKSLISMLKDEGAKVDLAVTLLTEDDMVLKGRKKVLKPRDNCVFEVGLFMGALGLDEKRSVMVSSVAPAALLSDLREIKVLPMERATPEQLKDEAWCTKTMSSVATELAEHVRNELTEPPKRPVLPVLSAADLFERERLTDDGGDLLRDTVVINTFQPVEERDIEKARQVVKNMVEHGVKYMYFFRADPDDTDQVEKVVGLLQSMVVSQLTQAESASDAERERIVRDSGDEVLTQLGRIQRRLFIHFIPVGRLPLYFCVHNATHADEARCYLRDQSSPQFYLWGRNRTAYNVADDLKRFCIRPEDSAIFYPSLLFNLYGPDGKRLMDALERQLSKSFRDSDMEKIKKLCFLEPETVKALAANLPSVPAAGESSSPQLS